MLYDYFFYKLAYPLLFVVCMCFVFHLQ